MKLTCPTCGHSGEIKGTDEFFEIRGQWPDGHWPVRKCRRCGAGIIVKLGFRKARATLIDADIWEDMQAHFDAAVARHDAGLRGPGFDARAAVLEPAADRFDDQLQAAPVDEYFTMMLLSFAWGGYQALQLFANSVEDPGEEITEAPALKFVVSLTDAEAASRALRAATWLTAARALAETWPERLDEVLEVARIAMPVDDQQFAVLSEFGAAAVAEDAADDDAAVASFAKFSRLSLEWVIEQAAGQRPALGQLMISTLLWARCFAHGRNSAAERLAELEQANPDLVP